MTAKDFTELIAWQRADALEHFALEMIKRQPVADDPTFCRQTIDCASSAPRNIAEGHGRFAPVPFANFLRIAIGSEQKHGIRSSRDGNAAQSPTMRNEKG